MPEAARLKNFGGMVRAGESYEDKQGGRWQLALTTHALARVSQRLEPVEKLLRVLF